MLTAVIVGVASAVVGSILTWYLQRRFTPNSAIETANLRKEVISIREQFAEFKQHAEMAERERLEFENFAFNVDLRQGALRNCIVEATNNSNYTVTVEAIQILRGDVDHNSPLTRAVKPRPNDDWTIGAGQSRSLWWNPPDDPASNLRCLMRDPDPEFPDGRLIPIMFALTLNVQGRRFVKKHTQQVCFQSGNMMPWGP